MVNRKSNSATLSLYTIVWGSALWNSTAKKIPWHDPSPRVVAEAASHMIWTYVQSLGGEWWKVLLGVDKPSVIGHAALLARMSGEPDLLISSIGGDVGFYHVTDSKHLRHFPLPTDVLVSCYLAESLAGHLDTGKWESLPDFAGRITERAPPRIQKTELTGDKARAAYAQLADIKRQTARRKSGPGAPRHFGLNTTAVRLVSDLRTPLPLRAYKISTSLAGRPWWWPGLLDRLRPAEARPMALVEGEAGASRGIEIPGGCANAVASVLTAIGLQALVPASARFEMRLALAQFEDAVLPVLVGDDAFDDTGTAADADLVAALHRLPKTWGEGETIRFTDPNYWIETIPEAPELLDEMYRIAMRHMI